MIVIVIEYGNNVRSVFLIKYNEIFIVFKLDLLSVYIGGNLSLQFVLRRTAVYMERGSRDCSHSLSHKITRICCIHLPILIGSEVGRETYRKYLGCTLS